MCYLRTENSLNGLKMMYTTKTNIDMSARVLEIVRMLSEWCANIQSEFLTNFRIYFNCTWRNNNRRYFFGDIPTVYSNCWKVMSRLNEIRLFFLAIVWSEISLHIEVWTGTALEIISFTFTYLNFIWKYLNVFFVLCFTFILFRKFLS